jgi:hypothetical protein
MRGKMCSSVRVLLRDAGEMSPAVLNLGQTGGGGLPVKMYRQSTVVGWEVNEGLCDGSCCWINDRGWVESWTWGAGWGC